MLDDHFLASKKKDSKKKLYYFFKLYQTAGNSVWILFRKIISFNIFDISIK